MNKEHEQQIVGYYITADKYIILVVKTRQMVWLLRKDSVILSI